MARERYVTRTVNVTTYSVMCLNIETAQPETREYKTTGKHTNSEMLKKLQKQHDTATLKLVTIIGTTEEIVLYGMPETEFIKVAKVLPPRAKTEETAEETAE